MTTRTGDRRLWRRYEVVGDLIGTFEPRAPQDPFGSPGAAPPPPGTAIKVHIVDIGTEGVLMATTQPPLPGDVGFLRVLLGTREFVAKVEVLHQGIGGKRPPEPRAGGVFCQLGEQERWILKQFLTTATT